MIKYYRSINKQKSFRDITTHDGKYKDNHCNGQFLIINIVGGTVCMA